MNAFDKKRLVSVFEEMLKSNSLMTVRAKVVAPPHDMECKAAWDSGLIWNPHAD